MTMVTESQVRRVLAAVATGFLPELGASSPINRLGDWLHRARWSSPMARASGLRRLAVAAIGSRGVVDGGEFANRVARLAVQWGVPVALRAAAQCYTGEHRERMLQAAELCEREPTHVHAIQARAVANDAASASAAVGDAADDAAYYAALAAIRADDAAYYAALAAIRAADSVADAADAIDAADCAVSAATYAADAAYAATEAVHDGRNDAAARAAYDAVLVEFAELVVGVLIDLRSPGAAYLHITDCDARHRAGLDVTA